MVAPVSIVVISGSVAVALIILFRYEQARGVRYLGGARRLFDRSVEHAKYRLERTYRRVTGQALRQSVHYIFHQILTATLRRIQRLEDIVHAVARFNKNRANHRREATSISHLSAVADHKREVALSDSQKQQRRDAALNGQ